MTVERELEPNAQCYTLMLMSYAREIRDVPDNAKTSLFEKAKRLFLSIKNPSHIHVNTVLSVCSAFPNEASWNFAFDVFKKCGKGDEGYPMPSSHGFTSLLLLCSENRSKDGLGAARDVWEKYLELRRKETKKAEKRARKEYPMDTYLVNALLKVYERTTEAKDAAGGLEIIKEYYGLPILSNDSKAHDEILETINERRKSGEIFQIDARTLDVIVRVANRTHPELALSWVDLLEKIDRVEKDPLLLGALVQSHLLQESFRSALINAQSIPEKFKVSGVNFRAIQVAKVCADAVEHYTSKMATSSDYPKLARKEILEYTKETLSIIDLAIRNNWVLDLETYKNIFRVLARANGKRVGIQYTYKIFRQSGATGKLIAATEREIKEALESLEKRLTNPLDMIFENTGNPKTWHRQRQEMLHRKKILCLLQVILHPERLEVFNLSDATKRANILGKMSELRRKVDDLMALFDEYAKKASDEELLGIVALNSTRSPETKRSIN